MRTGSRPLLALLALTALLMGVAPVGVASAQTELDAGAPAERRTWSIIPATVDGPDGRSHLVYDAPPGSTVTDHLAVTNHSTGTLTLDLYASDALTTPDGGFDLLPRDDAPVDVGAWLELATTSIEVAPGGTELVAVSLTVPDDAEPGDHAGGVVAATTSTAVDRDGQQVSVEHRVGTRVYLRVDGPLDPRLEISGLHLDHDTSLDPVAPGDARVSYTVRNTGNVRLLGQQLVTVTGPLGVELGRVVLPDLPELLPGATVDQSATVEGVWPLGRLWAQATVIPIDLDGVVEPDPVTASSARWAVPWLQLLVVGLVIAALALWRRRRRRLAEAGAPDRVEEGDDLASAVG